MKETSALFSLECEECNTKEEEQCLWTEGFAWLDSRNCFLWRKTGLELSYLQPFVNPSTRQLSVLFPTECLPQMLVLSPSLSISRHRSATLRLHSQSRSSGAPGLTPYRARPQRTSLVQGRSLPLASSLWFSCWIIDSFISYSSNGLHWTSSLPLSCSPWLFSCVLWFFLNICLPPKNQKPFVLALNPPLAADHSWKCSQVSWRNYLFVLSLYTHLLFPASGGGFLSLPHWRCVTWVNMTFQSFSFLM